MKGLVVPSSSSEQLRGPRIQNRALLAVGRGQKGLGLSTPNPISPVMSLLHSQCNPQKVKGIVSPSGSSTLLAAVVGGATGISS